MEAFRRMAMAGTHEDRQHNLTRALPRLLGVEQEEVRDEDTWSYKDGFSSRAELCCQLEWPCGSLHFRPEGPAPCRSEGSIWVWRAFPPCHPTEDALQLSSTGSLAGDDTSFAKDKTYIIACEVFVEPYCPMGLRCLRGGERGCDWLDISHFASRAGNPNQTEGV